MAKTNMVEREKRRAKVVKKYAVRRAELKELIRSPKTGTRSGRRRRQNCRRCRAMRAPPGRGNRCAITGRSRGVYRKFGLSRVKIREVANRGEIPGLVKASW